VETINNACAQRQYLPARVLRMVPCLVSPPSRPPSPVPVRRPKSVYSRVATLTGWGAWGVQSMDAVVAFADTMDTFLGHLVDENDVCKRVLEPDTRSKIDLIRQSASEFLQLREMENQCTGFQVRGRDASCLLWVAVGVVQCSS
jgi:hypothetical protein